MGLWTRMTASSTNSAHCYLFLASKTFRSLVEDVEEIQRNKLVYDKFQIALVDIEALNMDVPDAPFVEFRTPGSNSFFPYNDVYNYDQFKKFVVEFRYEMIYFLS